MIDLFNFEEEFYNRVKKLFANPCDCYELKMWQDGKLVYDSTKKLPPMKSRNSAPKSIKGDYDLSIHGNKIVLVDNKDGTTIETKCHPDDDFNIGVGIVEAFDRLNQQREENKKVEEAKKSIQLGDAVKVIDNGYTYTTYSDWCYKNLRFESVKKYNYGKLPYSGEHGKVIGIAPHGENPNITLVAFENDKNQVFVIDVNGLVRVGK